jgi:LacI family transcriptional regulator
LATRPTAICAGNDVLALAVLLTARDLGLRIPEDISLVGYDDSEYARLASPPLTTVRQRARDLGTAAARIALSRIKGSKEAPEAQIWKPTLVVRRSTAAPLEETPQRAEDVR